MIFHSFKKISKFRRYRYEKFYKKTVKSLRGEENIM